MKKALLILSFVIFCINSNAQNIQHNLEKYWYYRQRLKTDFLVVSSYNSQGTNLPAMARGGYIDNDGQFRETSLSWGDGNSGIQYYIGMLATEYRLLKDYGQDCNETLNDLVLALRAVERLDLTAESYYAPNHGVQQGDLNGFFIRDDVDSNFTSLHANGHNFYQKNGDPLQVQSEFFSDNRYPMSQDNCWHYLLNFALVVKLVDDNQKFLDASGQMVTVKEWVQKITNRMINSMHPSSYPHLIPVPVPSDDCGWFAIMMGWCWELLWVNPHYPDWEIINPVSGRPVPKGGAPILTNAGFAEAGNWITENKYGDLNYPNSKLWWPLFVSTVALSYEAHVNTDILVDLFFKLYTIHVEAARDAYGENALATVIGNPMFQGLIQWGSLYEHLRNFREERSQTLGVTAYEHFALIDLVLHSSGTEDNYYTDHHIYEQLLDEAPDCGPFNY
jgi:hypothetical protein